MARVGYGANGHDPTTGDLACLAFLAEARYERRMDRTRFEFTPELRRRVSANLRRHDRRKIDPEQRRTAAVAVVLVANEATEGSFILTRRASRMRDHAGQWALPGGTIEPGETPAEAACRELEEEVAMVAGPRCVLGVLDDYPTRSGFVITPVVIWGGEAGEPVANPREVAEVHKVPLSVLEGPEVPHLHRIPESDRPVLSIPMVGTYVHSPTAAILFQLREVGIHGRDTRVHHYEQPKFAWK